MASPTIRGILHFNEFEIFFPIGLLFEQWHGAIADLDPADRLVRSTAFPMYQRATHTGNRPTKYLNRRIPRSKILAYRPRRFSVLAAGL